MWSLRYSWFWLIPFCGWAQPLEKDTLSRSFWAPSELIVSLEASGLAKELWCDCGYASELEAQLFLRNILLEAQVGQSYRRPIRLKALPAQGARSDETYSSEGYFWRIGPALRISPKESFWTSTIGIHYAESSYREKMQLRTSSALKGTSSTLLREAWHQLSWAELSFGLKAELWRGLMLGYRTYYAFVLEKSESPELRSFFSPGYGRLSASSKFGIRYYLSYRLRI